MAIFGLLSSDSHAFRSNSFRTINPMSTSDLTRLGNRAVYATDTKSNWNYGRIAGGLFGIATQLLFLYSVVYLFQFLRYGGNISSN